MKEAFATALAVLTAIGGGGFIVAGLSGWLGKIWAGRLMAGERAKYAADLETLKRDLDVEKAKLVSTHRDKVALYRHVVDIVAPMVTTVDLLVKAQASAPLEVAKHFLDFETSRLRAYGYVAMFAPQSVMDRFDGMIDYLLDVADQKVAFDFGRVRALGIAMLNEIRRDLKIDESPIEYRGSRQ